MTRNIEDIQPGDLVLARDEYGTDIGLKPVNEAYRRTSYHLRHLTFEAEDGTRQTLSTTDEHPFWSETGSEFLGAGVLPVGHAVTSPDDERQVLVASIREEFPGGKPVFNFQVEGYHTYYVAGHPEHQPLLAHNADCDDIPSIDGTGKVHGDLPSPEKLRRMDPDDLRQLQDELRESVQERITKTTELGPKGNHGLRQGQEQDLISTIEKILENIKR